MKKTLFTILFILVYTTLLNAQWQTDVRLTNNPDSSWLPISNARSIASLGDTVHVSWFDRRSGNWKNYYKRSINGGLSWGTDIQLTNNPNASYVNALSLSGSNIFVVWQDNRHADWEIYFIRSSDAGLSWGTETRLTNDPAVSHCPSVASYGSNVYVVWDEYRNGMSDIYYKRSPDNGISWGQDIRLSNDPGYSWYPSIAVSGTNIHIVWIENRDGNWEAYYKLSPDGGTSWGQDIRLTNNSANTWYPSIEVSGLNVYVVWFDDRDGNNEVYYKLSSNGGLNWAGDMRLTNNSANSQFPFISVSGSNLHIVWSDIRDENTEIYYKRSTNGGLNWDTDARLTNNSASSDYPCISVNGSAVHVIWRDRRDGNTEIYYKRNPTGNPVGIKYISSEIPKEYSVEQNYPNPFNPTTKIRFAIPPLNLPLSGQRTGFSVGDREGVLLKIYDILGREVTTLVNEQLQPGTYEVNFDGSSYPSGVYFYKLTAGSFTAVNKMVLLK